MTNLLKFGILKEAFFEAIELPEAAHANIEHLPSPGSHRSNKKVNRTTINATTHPRYESIDHRNACAPHSRSATPTYSYPSRSIVWYTPSHSRISNTMCYITTAVVEVWYPCYFSSRDILVRASCCP